MSALRRSLAAPSLCVSRARAAMAVKEEKIEVEGEVVEALPSTMFRVQVDGGHAVLATISGRCASTTSASSPATGSRWSSRLRPLSRPNHLQIPMKVRPSVKPMCERCRVIKRHGTHHGHLHEPAPQAAAGVGDAMARIAGVNLPNQKRLEIGLTYIYGIGRTTAQRDLRRARALARHEGPRPHRRRGHAAPRLHRREPPGRGRPAPRALRRRSSACRRSARTAACATGATCR